MVGYFQGQPSGIGHSLSQHKSTREAIAAALTASRPGTVLKDQVLKITQKVLLYMISGHFVVPGLHDSCHHALFHYESVTHN